MVELTALAAEELVQIDGLNDVKIRQTEDLELRLKTFASNDGLSL